MKTWKDYLYYLRWCIIMKKEITTMMVSSMIKAGTTVLGFEGSEDQVYKIGFSFCSNGGI